MAAPARCLVVVASLLVLASLAQADLFDAYLYGTNVVSNIASPPTANGEWDATRHSCPLHTCSCRLSFVYFNAVNC
jgi:hypothetical protein